MENIHERPEHIAENERYIYEVGINSIEKIASENYGISYFINACAKTIIEERKEEFMRLGVLSSYVSSVYGGMSDEESRVAIGGAFMKGVITGVCVADQAYDDVIDITDAVIALESGREKFDDDNAFYREHGRTLIESGHQALERMLACNDIIDGWESACVTDIRYHQFYRLGLGVFMAGSTKAAYEMYKAADLRQMHDQLEAGDIDWDRAFRDLNAE